MAYLSILSYRLVFVTLLKLLSFISMRCFDDFFTAYLNEILIYSKNISIYTKHIQKLLTKLCNSKLFLDIWKCDFLVYKVKYLGLIIGTTGLKIDQSKVGII